MKAQPTASHFVDGACLEDAAGTAIEVIYRATGETLALLHEATPAVIEAALASAARAQGVWGRMRPAKRVRNVTDEMTLAREEVFGPVKAVLDFAPEEEAVTRANTTMFGLATGVFTADLTPDHRVVAGLEAGTCWINAYDLTPVEVPFGGSRLSGVGRENGRVAAEQYPQVKSVCVGMGPVDAPY
jgi:betaine-aldehyde dehydrogenase